MSNSTWIESVNDFVACEPFKNDLTEVVNKGTGFNTMKGLTTLTPLTVIYGSKEYVSGEIVYVRADLAKDPTAKIQYEIDSQKIVFIPTKEIRLVKKNTRYWGGAVAVPVKDIT